MPEMWMSEMKSACPKLTIIKLEMKPPSSKLDLLFIINIITLNKLLVTYIFGLLLFRIKCLTLILLLIRSDGIYFRILYNSCLVSCVFDYI